MADKREMEAKSLALMDECFAVFESYFNALVEKPDFDRAKEVAAEAVKIYKAVEVSNRYGDAKTKSVGSGVLAFDDLGSEESLRKLRTGDGGPREI